ncbi:hypothetical protein GB937_006951 [Aspergillus fischeri]|nr:hypothetical protein GB937_006951 [Aspergillus fischeri]
MVDNLIRNLEITLQNMQNAYSSRDEMPFWATKLLTPTFMAVAIFTTIPPPGPTRVIVGMTTFTSLWLYVLTHWVAGPSFFMDAIFMVSITVRWMLMFLTGTPEIDYYQNSKTATKLDSVSGDSGILRCSKFPNKVKWSVELWSCWRGQGWNFADQHLKRGEEQTQSRWDFLIANAARILLNRYISDIVRKYAFCAFWPAQQTNAASVDFRSLPMLHQHLLVAAQLIRDGLMLDSEYRKTSLLFVGLYLSTPDRWPGLFGSPADLYTIRNFWGRVWHQIFRHMFTRSGEVVARALGAEKGTLMYRYTKLYVGFLVSGVQHYACPLLIPPLHYGWGMFWQMPAYAAVITAEDLIKHYGKKAGIRDNGFVRGLGYVWTAYWMTLIYALPVGYVSDIGGFAAGNACASRVILARKPRSSAVNTSPRAIAAFVIANHASTARSDALDGRERGRHSMGIYIPHSTVNGQDLVMADVRGDDTPLLAGGVTADNINSIDSVFDPSFEALLAGSPLNKDPTTRDNNSNSCHTGYLTASPSDAWGDLSLFLPDYNISSLSHPEHVVAGIDQLPPLSVDASNTSSESGDCRAKCYTALLQQLLFLRQSLPESTRPSIDVILQVESHERSLLDRVLSCATCLSNRSSVLLMSVITERVIQMLDWIIEEKTLLDTESARSSRRTVSSWTRTSQLPPAGNRTDGRPYVCLIPLHVGSTELDEDTKQYFLKQLILMRMKKLAAKVQDVRRTTSARPGDCIYRAAELVFAESLQRLDYLRGQVQLWE